MVWGMMLIVAGFTKWLLRSRPRIGILYDWRKGGRKGRCEKWRIYICLKKAGLEIRMIDFLGWSENAPLLWDRGYLSYGFDCKPNPPPRFQEMTGRGANYMRGRLCDGEIDVGVYVRRVGWDGWTGLRMEFCVDGFMGWKGVVVLRCVGWSGVEGGAEKCGRGVFGEIGYGSWHAIDIG